MSSTSCRRSLLAGLILFYHRTYDLAALMLVGYALADEGLRGRERRTPMWLAIVSLFLIITRSATLVYGFGRLLPRATDIPQALCWVNCLLLVAMFGLCAAALDCGQRQ